jgi:hypothetical protein
VFCTEWFLRISFDVGLFKANSRLAEVVSVKSATRPRVCAVLYKTRKQAVNLLVQQDRGRPSTGIPEILDTQASVTEI